jgi:hypothetical protein
MANISAITSSGGSITVFVDSTSGFTNGIQASFAGLTMSGALASFLNGTSQTVTGVGSGVIQFDVPGAPDYPTGSGSDAETGTLTPLSKQQTVTLTFQDPSGKPLAGGQVRLRLQFDISQGTSTDPQVAAGIETTGTLDSNGSVTLLLWSTSKLQPSGAVYFVRAFTANGQLAYSDQMTT